LVLGNSGLYAPYTEKTNEMIEVEMLGSEVKGLLSGSGNAYISCDIVKNETEERT